VSEPPAFLDRVGVLRPLRHRDFALLWVGQTVSFIGDGVYTVAVAWLVYTDLGASPAAFAMVGLAWALPQVLFLLATGALSDRMDRRHLMVAGDLLRLATILVIGVVTLSGGMTVPLLVLLVFPYGIGAAVFGPAFHSIVPTIVPEDLLVQANSIGQVVRPVALTVLGPLLGGLLLTFGTGWAFIFDAVTFAVSAACILAIRGGGKAEVPEEERTDMMSDIRVGLRYVLDHAWLKLGMLGGLISLFCVWGPWETLVPFVVSRDLHGTGLDLALVFGAGGVGSVLVGLVMGQRGLGRKPVTTMYLAWALGMGMTAGFGVITHVWQGMVVAFVAEASISMLVVIWFTLLQRLVPNELLGRVSSVDWMISISGAPISFLIVGPLASLIGADRLLILAGVLGAATTIVVMFLPGARSPERDGSLAEPSAVAT
jgi:predicted outer membrane lipoprotein